MMLHQSEMPVAVSAELKKICIVLHKSTKTKVAVGFLSNN